MQELGDEAGQALGSALGEAQFDDEVLTLDVVHCPHRIEQVLPHSMPRGMTSGGKETDSVYALGLLLRQCGERRKRHGDSKNNREPYRLHEYLGRD